MHKTYALHSLLLLTNVCRPLLASCARPDLFRAMASPQVSTLFEQILHDVNAIPDLLNAAASFGTSKVRMLDSQAVFIVSQLRGLSSLSIPQATSLCNAISRVPWDSAIQTQMADRINELATVSTALVVPTKNPRRQMQTHMHFEHYQTEAEWVSLRSAAFIESKIEQMAQRAWTIGFTCPSEPSVARMVRILHCCQPAIDVQKTFNGLKDAIKSKDKQHPYPHGHIKHFPADPKSLSEDAYMFAFPDDAPVSTKLNFLAVAPSPTCRGKKEKRSEEQKVVDLLEALVSRTTTTSPSPSPTRSDSVVSDASLSRSS